MRIERFPKEEHYAWHDQRQGAYDNGRLISFLGGFGGEIVTDSYQEPLPDEVIEALRRHEETSDGTDRGSNARS